MAAGAAAAGLIKALSGSKAVKATANFAKGMKSMEETEKSGGFDKFEGGMQTLQGLMANMAPLMVPFQVLSATLAAGTTDATVNLMQTMLELLEKPGTQAAITAFSDLVSLLLDSLGTIIGWINDAADFFEGGAPGLARGSTDPVNVWQGHGSYFAGLEGLGDTGSTPEETGGTTRYREY